MFTTEPFYPLGNIQTGKYTPGGEYVIDDFNQDEYIGLYHILPNGQLWTESIPDITSKKLTKKRFDLTNDVKNYNRIRGVSQSNYVAPISYFPIIKPDDYIAGYIDRYFVQKRNNPGKTIQEINVDQYNTLNTRNQPGISMITYNYVHIKWTIKTIYAKTLNSQAIQHAEDHGFLHLSKYLINPLEFWK